MQPLISVVIPLYNAEKYVKECIDSILAQTIGSNNLEIIVVDDCSTDSSFELVQSTYANLANVKILKNEKNLGVGASRNLALKTANGLWVTPVDADDFLDNNFFEVMLNVANNYDPDIISMGYKEIIPDENGWKIKRTFNVTDKMLQLTEDKKLRMKNMCEKRFIANIWCKLIKNSFLKKYDIKSEDIPTDDVLMHFKLLYYADKYILIPESLYNFRQTPVSITRGFNDEKPQKMLNQYLVLFDYLDEYIKNMPEINSDPKLMKDIYDFFNFVYLDACFLQSCNGHQPKKIFNMILSNLEKYFGNKSYIVSYLLESYINTRSNRKITVKADK